MSRTSIVIDDDLVKRAMQIYRLRNKREAVDYALRRLVAGVGALRAPAPAPGSAWAARRGSGGGRA